ncbi:hypothetical protein AVEN_196892-1 [Araneus ventricosus]|uniref:Uncharacterized protein n=1 Tax=Araneus ventricosus TaxID=182803 RepID=A0A4Y2EDF5_ARAVE|nr:hypothetical protein AVEN_196892-1 [Araneus ventricosus]
MKKKNELRFLVALTKRPPVGVIQKFEEGVPAQRSIAVLLLKTKTTFLSIARGLVIRRWHFISKSSKVRPSITLVYYNLHKGWFGNPDLKKYRLLYSPKKTAFSSPRLVDYPVNQRLCQVTPATRMVSGLSDGWSSSRHVGYSVNQLSLRQITPAILGRSVTK